MRLNGAMFCCTPGLFSGQSGYEATARQHELGALSATVLMLPIYAHLSLGGQTVSLLTFASGDSGGVMPCLTGELAVFTGSLIFSMFLDYIFRFLVDAMDSNVLAELKNGCDS